MASEAQHFFDLFDSYWFAHQIFNKPHKNEESIAETPQILASPTVNIRSYSEQLLTNTNRHSFISDSPKLETIFSGVESKETQQLQVKENNKVSGIRRRKKKSRSKSLSELEFDELKGFMDLGFVFSEKDKESSLVSIIPGLQRLGKYENENEKEKEKEKEKEEVDGHGTCIVASRPYLSEAWDDLKRIREERTSRMVRIPALGNEMEIKNQLRFWAHSVASVVR